MKSAFWKMISFGLLLAVLFIVGCGETIETVTTTTTTTTTTVPLPKPSAPTGLRADSSVGSTIDLIWQATSESDIVGYNVYRSTTSESGYSKIAMVKRGRAFWDTGTTITSTDASAWVPHIAGTGVVFYPMPCHTSTQEGTVMYSLTQDADTNVTIYNIFGNVVWDRSYSSGTTGGTVGLNGIPWEGKDNDGHMLPDGIYPLRMSYLLTSESDYALIWDGSSDLAIETTYYYVVTAYNTFEVESEYSNEASAEARADGTTHWPVRIKPGSIPADPIYEYDPTLPSYR